MPPLTVAQGQSGTKYRSRVVAYQAGAGAAEERRPIVERLRQVAVERARPGGIQREAGSVAELVADVEQVHPKTGSGRDRHPAYPLPAGGRVEQGAYRLPRWGLGVLRSSLLQPGMASISGNTDRGIRRAHVHLSLRFELDPKTLACQHHEMATAHRNYFYKKHEITIRDGYIYKKNLNRYGNSFSFFQHPFRGSRLCHLPYSPALPHCAKYSAGLTLSGHGRAPTRMPILFFTGPVPG